jgi:hypothetical protein
MGEEMPAMPPYQTCQRQVGVLNKTGQSSKVVDQDVALSPSPEQNLNTRKMRNQPLEIGAAVWQYLLLQRFFEE